MVYRMAIQIHFFQLILADFNVDAVAISHFSDHDDSVTHHILTHGLAEIEVLNLPKNPLNCVLPVITMSNIVACPSISKTNGRIDCAVMRAEKLEAILSVPLITREGRRAALSIMNEKPRIWCSAETDRLLQASRSVQNEAQLHIQKTL